MEWDKLLRPYRLGCPKELGTADPNRNDFQRDYDRIIFSTAFRRLHGKTQVFPFPESDVIHTRLTHSLECASVGRSLGIFVENELKKKHKEFKGSYFGDIVSAACLAHDIKGDSDTKLYEKIVLITSYVAGMTDTFAIDTYRNLRGISLPNY